MAQWKALALLDLPNDALIALLSYLGHQDLLRVRATCTSLRKVASSDRLWAPFCSPWENTLNLKHWRAGVNSSLALFRLLKSFNDIVGCWTAREVAPRGGLLYVTWGQLSLVACRVVTIQQDELKLQRLFEVAGLEDGSTKVKLITTYISSMDLTEIHQPGTLVLSFRMEPEFYLESIRLCKTSEFSLGERELDLPRVHLANSENSHGAESSTGTEHTEFSLYRRLIVEEPYYGKELVGLWTGMYGPHGIEVINVTHTDEEIIGTKILGDPNVPCGEVTFRANFSMENTQVPIELQRLVDHQVFQFKIVKLYRGFGRIADHNFINPEWVPGQLLVDQNCNIAFLFGDDEFVIPFCKLDLSSLECIQKHVPDSL